MATWNTDGRLVRLRICPARSGYQFQRLADPVLSGACCGQSGAHGWKYGGKADGFLRIDGGKLGLWKGFGISAHAELNYGESPTSAGGTFLPNNLALSFPGANNTFADLSLYLIQQLGESVTVMFGKINTIDLYMLAGSSAADVVSSNSSMSSSLRHLAASHRR
jgi:hypothetical protein